MDSKYLLFVPLPRPDDKKTDTWAVINNEHGHRLGEVRWHGAWRRYCFFTGDGRYIFEQHCLRDIANFIEVKTKEYREAKKKSSNS